MADEDDLTTLRGRYFRERRFLLGVSALLLAHQWLGITVGRSAESSGLRFAISNPDRLWWALWVVWGWTMLSCAQQFGSIAPWKTYPKDRDDAARDMLSDLIAYRRVRKGALRYLRDNFRRAVHLQVEVNPLSRKKQQLPGGPIVLYRQVRVAVQWCCDQPNSGDAEGRKFAQAMEQKGWSVPRPAASSKIGWCRYEAEVSIPLVPVRDGRWVRRAAVVWTLLSTSYLTDYIVPLFIGMAPVLTVVGRVLERI